MTKIFNKIFFNSVLLVILLHAFIPHPHANDMTEKEHVAFHNDATSIFGFISLGFHESNDENLDYLVLEQCDGSEQKNIEHQHTTIITEYVNFSEAEKTKIRKIVVTNVEISNSLFIVKPYEVRGPPKVA